MSEHYGNDPMIECECFLHRRIRELEAEVAERRQCRSCYLCSHHVGGGRESGPQSAVKAESAPTGSAAANPAARKEG